MKAHRGWFEMTILGRVFDFFSNSGFPATIDSSQHVARPVKIKFVLSESVFFRSNLRFNFQVEPIFIRQETGKDETTQQNCLR